MFSRTYADVFHGDERWRGIAVPATKTYAWEDASTYIKKPPYFDGIGRKPPGLPAVRGARCLALFGDSITTDHISPAGAIKKDAPAGQYLQENGGRARRLQQLRLARGNHEVMMRGTFANTRIKNLMVPGVEGGVTAFSRAASACRSTTPR
jgi:aconitate hydratase